MVLAAALVFGGGAVNAVSVGVLDRGGITIVAAVEHANADRVNGAAAKH